MSINWVKLTPKSGATYPKRSVYNEPTKSAENDVLNGIIEAKEAT
jgi:hypothetical protein